MPADRFQALARSTLAALLCTLASACAHAAEAAPLLPQHHLPPHHREGFFQNNYTAFAPKGLLELMSWHWQARRDGLPRPPRTPTPVVAPEREFIAANARAGTAMQPAVTWIGHATVLAQLGGINLLTDPIFSERASPVQWLGPKRAQPPGLALHELPHIDAVVISHNHYDHCDEASLRALAAQPGGPPLFLVPLGMRHWMEGIAITHVVELDWWQSQRVGDVELVLTPVQHWSARGLHDRMRALWGGWAVFAPDQHLFFAGDTGYSADFADIRQRFAARQQDEGFDIALLPVGAYEPRWFMAQQHINPEEAVRIHRDLGARSSMGMHWGSFELTDESLDEPPRALAQARATASLAEEDFFVMAIGQTRRLPRRDAGQSALARNPQPAAASKPSP